jgi:uncharacterized protein YjbI with pentapeptide repeats
MSCRFTCSPDIVEERQYGLGRPELTPEGEWLCPRDAYGDSDRCLFHLDPDSRPDDIDMGTAVLETVRNVVSGDSDVEHCRFFGAEFDSIRLDNRELDPRRKCPLDLRGISVDGTLSLAGSSVTAPIYLGESVIGTVDASRADLRSIQGYSADIGKVTLEEADVARCSFKSAQVERVDLTNSAVDTANFRRATVAQMCLRRAEFDELQLEFAGVETVDLSHGHVEMADFDYIDAERLSLYFTRIDEVDLRNAHVDTAEFQLATFDGAYMDFSEFGAADFRRATLRRSYFKQGVYGTVAFTNTQFTQLANFTGASFESVSFGNDDSGAEFAYATFRAVTVSGEADFEYVSFDTADFRRATIESGTFDHVDCPRCSFDFASFGDVSFRYSSLGMADFNYAQFGTADFYLAEFAHADFRNAQFDEALFEVTTFEGGYFDYTEATSINFREAEITRFLSMNNSVLTQALFRDVTVERCEFDDAWVGYGDFSNSSMQRVSFDGTVVGPYISLAEVSVDDNVQFTPAAVYPGTRSMVEFSRAVLAGGTVSQPADGAVLYDLDNATIGKLGFFGTGTEYPLIQYVRFHLTEFDGFDIRDDDDIRLRGEYDIHTLFPGSASVAASAVAYPDALDTVLAEQSPPVPTFSGSEYPVPGVDPNRGFPAEPSHNRKVGLTIIAQERAQERADTPPEFAAADRARSPTHSPETVEATYLKAKNGASLIKDNTMSSHFFQIEMRYRRKKHIENLTEAGTTRTAGKQLIRTVSNGTIGYIAGYGERPRNVFVTSLLTIGLFSALYRVVSPEYGDTLLDYLLLSTGSFVTLITGNPSPESTGLAILTQFEGFAGAFLIALFVFTLTRSVHR